MKALLILFSILLTMNLHGATLNCVQNGQETQGMLVKAEVDGDFSVVSKKEVIFTHVTFDYTIDEGEHYSWSKGRETLSNLVNKLNYRPRKYIGHLKFSVLVNGYDREEYPGFGYLELIVPSDKITSFTSESFTSYLILTSMDDHFGGTISLDCKIK
ncbi:hypothetical protein [Halobacteriovorax sp. HLS]|uniref:hypothetical protein n=1 Tax=Halobacteriovorax sp. HLS TaxID=2234000 RepID=UPI000FDA8491|nr:hypothetical protein [Halobacteriovorax sp. HLS]